MIARHSNPIRRIIQQVPRIEGFNHNRYSTSNRHTGQVLGQEHMDLLYLTVLRLLMAEGLFHHRVQSVEHSDRVHEAGDSHLPLGQYSRKVFKNYSSVIHNRFLWWYTSASKPLNSSV
jgi:hypothetical protein